jgi:hypothetical protein
MTIKIRMTLQIPFEVETETTILPKGLSIGHIFCKLDDLCLYGEETINTPDS